ncbi:MAG: hypothetical protein F4Z45_02935 [Gammaproteobacteria bacterium]|nr:hypothetical protein [Gammaproteobacteria bacterium]
MSIEVNTVDDNIVQADRVHSLELKRFGNKLGAKRIVVKEDDLWMATVRRRGGHAGGRCLAWAACQQGPSPEEDRYTVRGGIEFGQPGYDPNAAVTGCLHDLWDRTSACTRTQGGSPKRLVIGTGGPLAFAKGLDGPDGGDHYDLGEGEGGYYYINKQRRVDGGATSLAPFQVLSLYAYCDGPACGEAPFVLAAPLPDPYETITVAANVLTDRDSFSRSLVGDCNSGEANLRFEVIPARRVLSASVNIGGTFRTLKLPPSGAEIPFPEADRIKFLPASIDWCE